MRGAAFQAHSPFEILSNDQTQQIHTATIEVLEKTGVIVENEKAKGILTRLGARVTGDVVLFPEGLVNDLMKSVPSELTLHARDPEKNLLLNKGRVHCTNGYGTTFVKDLSSDELRKAGTKDLRDFLILCDCLDNVHYLITQFIVQDVPPALGDLYQAREMVRNSTKHLGLSVSDARNIDFVIEIGELAGTLVQEGQRPIFSMGVTSHSPLKYTEEGAERLMRLAMKSVPVRIVSGAIAGSTSPVTLAGTLVVQNAEVLAGILISQATKPGAPVMYGSFAGPMDMATGKQVWGVPELALLNAATAQICRFYDVPYGYGSGGVADSTESDIQAGIEKTLTLALTAAAGVDVIHDGVSGLLGTSMISSFEQLIIDHEIATMVLRAIRGIDVGQDTLAVDLIDRVGHSGSFLTEDHTFNHMRRELYLTKLLDRRSHNERTADRSQGVLAKANRRAREILETHKPIRLGEEIEKEINRVIQKAAARWGVSEEMGSVYDE